MQTLFYMNKNIFKKKNFFLKIKFFLKHICTSQKHNVCLRLQAILDIHHLMLHQKLETCLGLAKEGVCFNLKHIPRTFSAM